MSTKRMLILAFIAVSLLSIMPFIFYYYEFGSYTLSTKKEEWGLFGDFIGGVLNPFLSLANIFVLGYLTYELSNIDQNMQTISLETQKKLVMSQLRQDAFEEYVRRIDNVLYNYDDAGKQQNASVGHKANMAWERIEPLNENYAHLFPLLKTDKLFTEVGEVLLNIRRANVSYTETQKEEFLLVIHSEIEKLKESRRVIKEKLQTYMMEELSK